MTFSKEAARILVIAPQPFYQDRGTPIAIRRLLEALSERGDIVDLLTFPIGEDIELPGLSTYRIPNLLGIRQIPIGFSIRKLLLDLIMIPVLTRRLARQRYSSIHAVEEAVFFTILAARKYEIPVVYDMQSSLPEQLAKFGLFRMRWTQNLLLRFERWAIKNSTHVVCSAGLRRYVESIDDSAQVNEWRFPAVKQTVSADRLQELRVELGLTRQDRIILYTGNFEPYQGIQILLQAAQAVLAEIPEAVFILVGASCEKDFSLGPEAEELAGKGALKIVSRKPRAAVDSYLAIADLLVSPRGWGQNLPLKIFDYMAVGKPILASDCLAHRTLLDDSRAVLVGASAGEWSNAIIRILQSPKETENLVAAAEAFADGQLGWNTFREKVWTIHNYV